MIRFFGFLQSAYLSDSNRSLHNSLVVCLVWLYALSQNGVFSFFFCGCVVLATAIRQYCSWVVLLVFACLARLLYEGSMWIGRKTSIYCTYSAQYVGRWKSNGQKNRLTLYIVFFFHLLLVIANAIATHLSKLMNTHSAALIGPVHLFSAMWTKLRLQVNEQSS